MGRLILVTGGQKSGKSRHAEQRARGSSGEVVVVTPAVAWDPGFAARVARHQADRPDNWQTLERFDLDGALIAAGDNTFVIVDALDTWLAEQLVTLAFNLDDAAPTVEQRHQAEQHVLALLDQFAAAASERCGTTVVIAGQPGLGAHVSGAGARAYVDLHGIALQHLGACADEAVLIIAGLPVSLKDLP